MSGGRRHRRRVQRQPLRVIRVLDGGALLAQLGAMDRSCTCDVTVTVREAGPGEPLYVGIDHAHGCPRMAELRAEARR